MKSFRELLTEARNTRETDASQEARDQEKVNRKADGEVDAAFRKHLGKFAPNIIPLLILKHHGGWKRTYFLPGEALTLCDLVITVHHGGGRSSLEIKSEDGSISWDSQNYVKISDFMVDAHELFLKQNK